MAAKSVIPADYGPWLSSLKSRIAGARQRAALRVCLKSREGSCGEGFWPWPRRRGLSGPAAVRDARANPATAGPPGGFSRKRPAGFVARRLQTF